MKTGSSARRLPSPEERDLLFFNGIDGATGEYLQPPITPSQLVDLARREPRYHLPDSGRKVRTRGLKRKGPGEGVDPRDFGQTGWGVIFARSVSHEVKEALSPLLAFRRRQASCARKERYRELKYQTGESKTGFLARHGIAPGPAEPDRLPYYLLLIGDPEEIPFEFQFQLDVQYAVGRLHFSTPEEYAYYASSVIDSESGKKPRPRSMTFFGPRNPHDVATELSSDQLAACLTDRLTERLPDWSIRSALGAQATQSDLKAILEGAEAPALLFTAGHGLCYRADDKRQVPFQGSLVCQDWPGPGEPVKKGQFFSADDVSEKARIAGLVAFHFSCYGAGTPRRDGFPEPVHGERQIAPHAFLSRLSQRLLAHPAGGALAVIGHVDRAWSWSFVGLEGRAPALRPVFENALKRLAGGYPVGFAMEFFNACYAELASDLDEEIRRARNGSDRHLAQLWTNRNDARNYAVLGDPAVRLAINRQEAPL